jgi:hypothetical protein
MVGPMRPGRFSNQRASPVIRCTPRMCSFWCSATMNIYSEVSSDAARRALKRLGKRLDTER